MYIIKLKILTLSTITEDLIDAVESYLIFMYKSKQIINEEYHYIPIEGGLELYLFCPEKDSFSDKNSNKHTKRLKLQLINNFNSNLKFEYIAIDPEFGKIAIPKKSKFLILKYSRVSSILDGETFDEIPFYKIPFTLKGKDWATHGNLHHWERDYNRIKGIWYSSEISENWSRNQLQNLASDLNQSGVVCCERIEEVTGVPTYYFLMNWRAWGRKKDKKRKCPKCKGDWLIKGSTFNDTIAFKCDNCRLVSELSSNK